MTPIETAIAGILADKAKKFALGDLADAGEWRGHYLLTKIGEREWLFENDSVDPLHFHHKCSGFDFMSGSPSVTDLGSIPRLVEKFAPEKYMDLKHDSYPEAFEMHDFICENGFVFVRKPGGLFEKMDMSKVQADVLLFLTLSAPSPTTGREANRITAQAIYRACRLAHSLAG